MADITRWDPFGDLAGMRQALDRFFGDEPWGWRSTPTRQAAGFPLDLYETNEDVVVEAALPGVKADDIDISVTGQLLTIKGETKDEHEEKAQNFYRHERSHGTFVRQVSLPSDVDSQRADARFEDGVLRLRLPKSEAMKPKTIRVQATGQTGAIEAESKPAGQTRAA
jgi:HSP20 family protein